MHYRGIQTCGLVLFAEESIAGYFGPERQQPGAAQKGAVMRYAKVREICDTFAVESIQAVAEAFTEELEKALQNQSSSLKILPSYLSSPSGQERGDYIAIDFGGTNVRVMLISLLGNGRYAIGKRMGRPLADAARGYDLTALDATGEELFAFVAELVENVLDAERDYALGLTFSYPMRQDAIDKACLIEWTKEIKTSATAGRDIKSMLSQALRGRGLHRINPVAIINDTVAAFMAGTYSHPDVCMGSICGTGHNTCYREASLYTDAGLPMVVNIEAGNFSLAAGNPYDRFLDSSSLDPGKQLFEKMVSGKYMGELFRLLLLDLVDKKLLPAMHSAEASISRPFVAGAEILNWLSVDGPAERVYIDNWLNEHGFPPYQNDDREILAMAANAILNRAIRLIAASFQAVLSRATDKQSDLAVAIDGSVFEKIPGFSRKIEMLLNQNLPGSTIKLIHTAHGSNIGAAVAAAQKAVFSL